MPKYSCGERGLDVADTLLREVALFWICAEQDHVDVDVLLLLVERRVPFQMRQRNSVPFRNLRQAGADQRPPVLRVGVAQALRVLPPDGDHRRPDIPLVACHLLHRFFERWHLAVGIPEPVVAIAADAGAVCDVVDIYIR